jgi:hypothetical protein
MRANMASELLHVRLLLYCLLVPVLQVVAAALVVHLQTTSIDAHVDWYNKAGVCAQLLHHPQLCKWLVAGRQAGSEPA